jgi:hypothetical protein
VTAATAGLGSSRPWIKAMLGVIVALIAAMWVYAFFFAPTEGINRIGDRKWSQRAQERCAAAGRELFALRDVRTIEEVGPDALAQRAEIVAKTNVILTTMVDALEADVPSDAKGREIVPKWIADYRTYLGDRTDMVARLRAGENVLLNETEVKGSPISNFINDFARQNEMKSCQTPTDLAI